MRKFFLFIVVIFCISLKVMAQIWPVSTTGHWTFDNLSNPLQAETGNNLTITGTHIATEGAGPMDGAYEIGVGSYYTCTHGIAANGGGTLVNEYSILFDVKFENPTVYHCLFQTNTTNSNDGDGFLNASSQIGVSASGYTGMSLDAGQWYRIVLTVDNGTSFRYYVNGHQVNEGTVQTVDGRFSLESTVLLFADDDGEDNPIICSQLATFGSCLTPQEVTDLGGFRSSDIKPYLQTPTPNSMFISWNAFDNGSTKLAYGTTTALGDTITGAYEDISSNRWHTAQLTGLTADTRYYYRCISGNDSSAVYSFRTPFEPETPGKHIRFIKVGDTQANAGGITGSIADSIQKVLQVKYGQDWVDSISFIMHTGDLNQSGAEIARYMNEFFNPYAVLSANIPTMISIGNHEGENGYYYRFMKYESLTGFSEKYYRFDLGNCCFIALNTNGLYNNATQTNWLQTQLNQTNLDTAIDFVFVYNHQPVHSEVWPDGNTGYVETSIFPLLKNYPKVTLNTWGHSHNYERGTIVSNNNKNWDFRSILFGGGGGALDRWGMYANQTDYPEIQKSIDHYGFFLVDVDVDAGKAEVVTYSLGNTDQPTPPTIIDQWHRYIHQPAPEKPSALWPSADASDSPVLTASLFAGVDSLMSSQFQVVSISGNFSSPLADMLRDNENFYGDSGTPDFIPTNLNEGIDLQRCAIAPGTLQTGETYMWRMRYRDNNARWSDWSDTLMFTVVANPADVADFTANVTSGEVPLTVHFTDLSIYNPTAWEWDLDGDGSTDATDRDPIFTYTTPGLYTVSLTTTVNAQSLVETKQFYINAVITGSEAIDNNSGISAYPNPSTGNIRIIYPENNGVFTFQIVDICGKIVFQKSTQNREIVWNGKNSTGEKVLPGVYFCRIISENKETVVKIIML